MPPQIPPRGPLTRRLTLGTGLAIALCLSVLAGSSYGRTLELTVTMDNGSRFYEYFSAAYAELGAPWPSESEPETDCSNNDGACDGWFAYEALPEHVPFGSGDRIFRRGPDLLLGSIEFDDSNFTGVGLESAPVIGFGWDSDIAADVGGDDLVTEELGPYTTAVPQSSVEGVVRFENGVMVGIDLTADVVFEVPIPFPPNQLPFNGTFTLEGHRMTLLAGPEQPTVGAAQIGWEITGAVNQVLPGDYDNNGVVDGQDHDAWAAGYGESREPWTGADGNGDGVVDAADYTVWRDHRGLSSMPAAGVSVPEPAAAGLFVVGMLSASALGRARA